MRRQRWKVLALVTAVILMAHSTLLYFLRSHLALSGAVAGGVIIVILISHLGLLRPLLAIFRRRLPRPLLQRRRSQRNLRR